MEQIAASGADVNRTVLIMNRNSNSFLWSLIPFAAAAMPLVLGGCSDGTPDDVPPEPEVAVAPLEMVVVLDLSGSLSDSERELQEALLSELAASLSFGDRLVVQVAHASGVRGGAPPVVVEMPTARNPARPLPREEVALRTARGVNAQAVGKVFETGEMPSTDLIASLHTARNRFSLEEETERTLVVLSDMLQCAGGLCFEQGRGTVPDSTWIARQRSEGTIPDLTGVCVAVAGADPSTSHGVRVREFWEAYFAAAGAELAQDRYRHEVSSADQLRCEAKVAT